MRHLLASTVFLLAASARAEDCIVTAGPRDRISQTGDVVVEAGQTVENAMALNGNVIVRPGARVKSAIAVNGNVTVEARAKVTETAAAFGGKITVAPDARVQGARIQLGDRVQVAGENGKKLDLQLSVGGTSLTDLLLTKMVEKVRTCRLVAEPKDAGVKL